MSRNARRRSKPSQAAQPRAAQAATLPIRAGMPVERAPKPSIGKALVSTFVLLHLVAILAYATPWDIAVRKEINRLTGGYLRSAGLWQSWDMFAPNPRKMLLRMDATITLDDGRSVQRPLLPRSDSLIADLRRQRYRKWAHDHLRLDTKQRLRPPAARYLAREFDGDDARPVQVELARHWQPMLKPNQPQVEQVAWKKYTFYRSASDGAVR
jgi:hypothetical protein